MDEKRSLPPLPLDPPASCRFRLSFHLLWIVDMCTAMLLILVTHAIELNPVTVYSDELFGIIGVAIAAGCYAAVVVSIGLFLSHPIDFLFLVVIVTLYVFFVFNNLVVLAFDYSIFATLASSQPA